MAAQCKQGQVYRLQFPIALPDNTELEHPVLIISSNWANSYESSYTAVMLTHHEAKSVFSFELQDEMFESPLSRSKEKPRCFARTYITVVFNDSQVKKFVNQMKPAFFKILMNQIKESVFNID